MAIGTKYRCTVGEVEKKYDESVRMLINELARTVSKVSISIILMNTHVCGLAVFNNNLSQSIPTFLGNWCRVSLGSRGQTVRIRTVGGPLSHCFKGVQGQNMSTIVGVNR